MIAQSPNFFGHLEEMKAIGDAARKVGAVFVASFDPICVGVLKRPGDYGADIAVAEGQGLGMPLGYGGPYLGILACRNETAYLRKIPGRLVGQTTDRNGKRCWVLTLQTARAAHPPREGDEQHLHEPGAARAAGRGVPDGPRPAGAEGDGRAVPAEGPLRRRAAVQGSRRVAAVQDAVRQGVHAAGARRRAERCSRSSAPRATTPACRSAGGIPQFADCMTVAVTEKRTKAEIDGLVAAMRDILKA